MRPVLAIAHQAIGINGSGLGVMVGTSFNLGHPNELDILNVSDPQNTFNFRQSRLAARAGLRRGRGLRTGDRR